jgi:type I restriction enzyme S subunit
MIGLDFKSYAAGSAVGTLNRNNIHQIYVDIPEVSVQRNIVEIIENNNSVLSAGISKAQTEIEKAKEYQESLITQL